MAYILPGYKEQPNEFRAEAKKTHNGEYWDHGKENGHYYMVYWGYIGIMEKKMETTMRHPPLQQGAARN